MFDRTAFAEIVTRAVQGGIAGILGGVVFGVWLADQGAFSVIASMAGASSPLLGILLHLSISAAIGASFGLFFARLAEGVAPSLLWGTVNGFLWWFLGPLTLMPIAMGIGPQWTASAIAGSVGSLFWHLVFGGVMGIAYAAIAQEGLLALGSTIDTEAGQAAPRPAHAEPFFHQFWGVIS